MRTQLSVLILLLFCCAPAFGQAADRYNVSEAALPGGKTLVFKFLPEDDMFYIPFQGNIDRLDELVATVDHYKKLITDGIVKINVAGYSSALATRSENLNSAVVRANRVKSELILRNGIREEHFVTTVHATGFEGRKSAVVVTLRVPQIEAPQQEQPKPEPKPAPEPAPKVVEEQPTLVPPPAITEVIQFVLPVDGYRFALRTNLLYNALLVPNLGIEWRTTERVGVLLSGGGSNWGSSTGNVQKLWYINPEVRYYLGGARRWYAGVSGNFGEYNIYKGMIGNLISKETGYQGSMWNAGAVAGYQLPLGQKFALDFNLGLGYRSFEYDSFGITNGVRVYEDRDQTKNTFGLTQAGVTLVWKICK